MSSFKPIIRQLCPPFIFSFFLRFKNKLENLKSPTVYKNNITDPKKQDLDMYWDADYANILEEWGRDNVWNEIQMILSNCKGKVLDIACGTGITIKLLEKFSGIELYGFDISDLLIQKAVEKNIPKGRLKVADATKTNYSENEFDYSYSIGSLEHFTFDGIDKFIYESARYTKVGSFHMIPVSRSGKDEGWMKTTQSFFNNSEEWWMRKFKKQYQKVIIINSKWNDDISFGRWYICYK